MEKEQQEFMVKLNMFEQQIKHLQEQLQAVEQAIVEMSSLSIGLDELIGSEDKEILAQIGRGIFVKAKILSEELTVDVGGKNFIKKTIPETKKTIEEQIKKLEEVKKELEDNLEKLSRELMKVYMEEQGKDGKRG